MAEVIIGSITLFYMFIMLLCVVFGYLFRFDVWLQGIMIITFVFTFAVFIPHTYHSFNLENEVPVDRFVSSLGGIDVNNYAVVDQLSLEDTENFYVNIFDFEQVLSGRFTQTTFCMGYNNSDLNNNILKVVNEEKVISGDIFIERNSSGVICKDINSSHAVSGDYLGVACGDCSGSNPLNIWRVSGDDVSEVEINTTDNSFVITEGEPLLNYVVNRMPAEESVKKTFYTYMMLLGFIVLIFIMRLLVVFIDTFRKVVL